MKYIHVFSEIFITCNILYSSPLQAMLVLQCKFNNKKHHLQSNQFQMFYWSSPINKCMILASPQPR